ncbi:alkaline-phosphatase-like protein [Ephemerocybe angulata]|uniref:alkaline phosphatase n=1 Tax=Ephemerocybe angulata TaxID=980116 RepID=A0A8H6M5G7_9AGAR|nr:alkaline-phosphatase-like protein [Tulosesus angulatus]
MATTITKANTKLLSLLLLLATSLTLPNLVSAQTFQRLGACPTLGCIFPPDQTDFLAGQLFDLRLEVHAPVNGTEAGTGAGVGVPDEGFSFCVAKVQEGGGKTGECVDVGKYFKVKGDAGALEKWSFTYYEDLFARDAGTLTGVNVAAKAYRALSLNDPGHYQAKLSYTSGGVKQNTVANWIVREPAKKRKAKNVLFFIGDGMTQPMITASRLIAHKSINGKYQTLMQLDQMEALGLQMTHSIDSFITDSANSATALYTGKKSGVNALGVWVDSSKDVFDDPKVETIAELFRRRTGGPVGIVSTAYIADATPGALCSHTRDRSQSASVVFETLYNATSLTPKYDWPTSCKGPDVLFGGGAEQFIAGAGSYNGTDFYKAFEKEGYQVVYDNTQLKTVDGKKKALGIFSVGNMAKWVDRNVLTENLKGQKNSPTGDGSDALDQPGLKDMTLKAIDVLQKRSAGKGWFMMSEAASIDKMMHAMDYDRALGELLELDDTVRASIEHLEKIGELDNTLIVVTADHGHGFDVFGGADTKYLAAQTTDRKKRGAVGTYRNSGLSGYTVAPDSLPNNQSVVYGAQGPNFPVQWSPRYAYAAGFGASPDHRESYTINEKGPRTPATKGDDGGYVANPAEHTHGFSVSGTIPIDESQGVHSLQDVPVYAKGPGAETFRGVYNSVDIFFKIADALALGKAN